MLMYKVTPEGYGQFKKDLQTNKEAYPWFESEKDFLDSFKADADREVALQQIKTLNSKYHTHLSFGGSEKADESSEFADFIISERFRKDIKTTDKNVAAALVTDFAKAAKTRGLFQLSFASKYCHHCNPNMFPIFDSVNEKYLRKYHSYSGYRDYRRYIDAYARFCKKIGVQLEKASKKEGFYVDKFINNIEK